MKAEEMHTIQMNESLLRLKYTSSKRARTEVKLSFASNLLTRNSYKFLSQEEFIPSSDLFNQSFVDFYDAFKNFVYNKCILYLFSYKLFSLIK